LNSVRSAEPITGVATEPFKTRELISLTRGTGRSLGQRFEKDVLFPLAQNKTLFGHLVD
jgi:hypothetical protein